MKRRIARLVAFWLAGALALGLAACGEKPDEAKKAARNEASPPPVADAAKQEPFKSAVTPAESPGQAPMSKLREDNELSGKVKRVLSNSTGGTAAGVEVSASDGVVTLFGTVDKPDQRHELALLAANVDGVRSVINNLVVVRGS